MLHGVQSGRHSRRDRAADGAGPTGSLRAVARAPDDGAREGGVGRHGPGRAAAARRRRCLSTCGLRGSWQRRGRRFHDHADPGLGTYGEIPRGTQVRRRARPRTRGAHRRPGCGRRRQRAHRLCAPARPPLARSSGRAGSHDPKRWTGSDSAQLDVADGTGTVGRVQGGRTSEIAGLGILPRGLSACLSRP